MQRVQRTRHLQRTTGSTTLSASLFSPARHAQDVGDLTRARWCTCLITRDSALWLFLPAYRINALLQERLAGPAQPAPLARQEQQVSVGSWCYMIHVNADEVQRLEGGPDTGYNAHDLVRNNFFAYLLEVAHLTFA